MKILKTIRARAHCDIPCGIYDPTPAKIAAKTIARMIEQMEELSLPIDNSKESSMAYTNSITRRIIVKDEHAEICKKELEILWSDFFKPDHLEKYPNLHDLFWNTIKLASKTKQESRKEDADGLASGVDEIAKIFYEVKSAPERFEAYKQITDNLY